MLMIHCVESQVALSWDLGKKAAEDGAAILAHPTLRYDDDVFSARSPVTWDGAIEAASGLVMVDGVRHRVVVGYGSGWMLTCSATEPGGTERCVALIDATRDQRRALYATAPPL